MSQKPPAYGLILTKKPISAATSSGERQLRPQKLSYFEQEDEAGSDDDVRNVAAGRKSSDFGHAKSTNVQFRQRKTAVLKPSTQLLISTALQQDPSVFEYDAVYDDMVAHKELAQVEGKRDKIERKAKYVETLLQSAAQRQLKRELREERAAKVEREAEGEEFAGKDQFVTTAYRKKLEAMRVAEEAQRQRDDLDTNADGTKQNDMGKFYKNILDQRVGEATPRLSVRVDRKKSPDDETENKSNSETPDLSTAAPRVNDVSDTPMDMESDRNSGDADRRKRRSRTRDSSTSSAGSTPRNTDANSKSRRKSSSSQQGSPERAPARSEFKQHRLPREGDDKGEDTSLREKRALPARTRNDPADENLHDADNKLSETSKTLTKTSTSISENTQQPFAPRRNTEESINDARLRYLQRKQQAALANNKR